MHNFAKWLENYPSPITIHGKVVNNDEEFDKVLSQHPTNTALPFGEDIRDMYFSNFIWKVSIGPNGSDLAREVRNKIATDAVALMMARKYVFRPNVSQKQVYELINQFRRMNIIKFKNPEPVGDYHNKQTAIPTN